MSEPHIIPGLNYDEDEYDFLIICSYCRKTIGESKQHPMNNICNDCIKLFKELKVNG